MVEMRKDERKVKREGDKLVFYIKQEQVYEQVTVDKMIAEWKKDYAEKQKWLENFDNLIVEAHKATDQQLEAMKKNVQKELENIEQGLVIWDVK